MSKPETDVKTEARKNRETKIKFFSDELETARAMLRDAERRRDQAIKDVEYWKRQHDAAQTLHARYAFGPQPEVKE